MVTERRKSRYEGMSMQNQHPGQQAHDRAAEKAKLKWPTSLAAAHACLAKKGLDGFRGMSYVSRMLGNRRAWFVTCRGLR